MGFFSFHFLAFLALVLLLSALLWHRFDLRKNLLLIASYYFYMSWDWRLAFLLLYMTAVNYFFGRTLASARDARLRSLLLWSAILSSVGCLAIFKYFDFFVGPIVAVLELLGANSDSLLISVAVPVGLSFYTFQSLSYVLDIHRGHEEPCRSFRDFALFVGFFPSLLSGPITRSRQLLPQLRHPGTTPAESLRLGVPLMLRGVAKKILIADVIAAHIVDPAFSDAGSFSSAFLFVAVVAYSFQIYMDLSGYTDMARGLARILGFDLPQNFNRPYWATSVSNFWQRWHMTMSGFFRDYLYFGLGGSKTGNVYLNLMITFLVIGLWHGAGLNFALYGALHGGVVCAERWFRYHAAPGDRSRSVRFRDARMLGLVAATFFFVAFSRVLFRAPDLNSARSYIEQLLWSTQSYAPWTAMGVTALVAAVVLHICPARWSDNVVLALSLRPAPVLAFLCSVLIVLAIALGSGEAGFVYFQF